MLRLATYRYPGTNNAMSDTYSLKISTRPTAGRYEEKSTSGNLGHEIKRVSFHRLKRGNVSWRCVMPIPRNRTGAKVLRIWLESVNGSARALAQVSTIT